MDRVTAHEQRQRCISVLFVGSPPVELWNDCDAFRADSVEGALSKYLGSSIRVVPEAERSAA
mgnify:CR=1 FL=1